MLSPLDLLKYTEDGLRHPLRDHLLYENLVGSDPKKRATR